MTEPPIKRVRINTMNTTGCVFSETYNRLAKARVSSLIKMLKRNESVITINNLKNASPVNEFDVRVDRKTVFGNPFHMALESQRNDVCDQYEKYFQDQVENNIEFRQALSELICIYKKHGILNMFCWCSPKRCHAETIKAYVLRAVAHGNQ
jgi:hypothetical protein